MLTVEEKKKDMYKSLKCLYVAVDEPIAADVNEKVKAYMLELYDKLEKAETELKELKAASLRYVTAVRAVEAKMTEATFDNKVHTENKLRRLVEGK